MGELRRRYRDPVVRNRFAGLVGDRFRRFDRLSERVVYPCLLLVVAFTALSGFLDPGWKNSVVVAIAGTAGVLALLLIFVRPLVRLYLGFSVALAGEALGSAYCHSCGYDMTGAAKAERCPECGEFTDKAKRRAQCQECGYTLVGIEDADRCPECGKSIGG